MRKFLKALILVPIALVLIIFALANRQFVTFTLDPFGDSTLAFSLPLFALAFILVILGVIIGGVATWLRQHRWRRATHQLDRELSIVRTERDALKRALADAQAAAQPVDMPRLTHWPPAA
jgi:uncharacterized integral membrane protein